jgi:hypothetical protein
MYQAEIRGKLSRDNENREDILTSNVFSFFKYASRKDFLYPLLLTLNVEITIDEAEEAEFRFWPRFSDGTEPDLVLVVGQYYLLFEAKYHSGFGLETSTLRHQLVREIEGGELEAKTMAKKFRLFALTADYYEPPYIRKTIPQEYVHVYRWVNWQSIAFLIYRILEKNTLHNPELILFANDLYQLFLKKNLRGYEGIRFLSEITRFSGYTGTLFFDASTADYRGDFIGFSQVFDLDLADINMTDKVFFSAASASFRGDFIGFPDSLAGSKSLDPVTRIFFTSRISQRFKFRGLVGPINQSPDCLFFRRREE